MSNEMNNQAAQTMPEQWPEYVMLRDTKLHDDAGGLGQRIYTTAGAGYKKVKYVREDIAALSQTAGVPEGWKLVPVEPTAAMCDAMRISVGDGIAMKPVYRAMLAATPPAPQRLAQGDSAVALEVYLSTTWGSAAMRIEALATWLDQQEENCGLLSIAAADLRAMSAKLYSEPTGEGDSWFADALTSMGEVIPLPTQPPHQDRGEVEQRARELLNRNSRTYLQDIDKTVPVADALRALEQALTQQRGECEPLGYTALFNAIASATWPATEGVAINVSVAKFHESIGGNVYTTPQPSADAVRELVKRWRGLADSSLRRSGTWDGKDMCDRIEKMADELESMLSGGSHA